MKSEFQQQLQCDPDLGLVFLTMSAVIVQVVGEVYPVGISLRAFVTSAEVTLASPGAGDSDPPGKQVCCHNQHERREA